MHYPVDQCNHESISTENLLWLLQRDGIMEEGVERCAKGATSQEMQAGSRGWKGKEIILP